MPANTAIDPDASFDGARAATMCGRLSSRIVRFVTLTVTQGRQKR
jgi:hypothetical protein